ncbi:MAG: hypothetical protein E7260_06965 [Lachnospiraceae bacterium]|nr:hypothetical protein [Lachnospiraceae bacterium]
MKNRLKKVLVACFAALFGVLLFNPAVAKAEEMTMETAETVIEYGEPIEEISYIDEDGCLVTECLYFVPDYGYNVKARAASSGAGWFRKTKELTWDNGLSQSTFYYAEGYFVWGDGEVSVSNYSGGWDHMASNATVSNISLEAKTGKYLGIFNNYASVTFSFTVTNVIGIERDCSVTIRISEKGRQI